MRRHGETRQRLLVLISVALLSEHSRADEPILSQSQPLVGGTATSVRPEIGTLGFCTATLVDPRYIVTAAHCFDYTTGPRNDSFQVQSVTGATVVTYTVNFAYALGRSLGEQDIALARLATPVPNAIARPTTFSSSPSVDDRVSVFGYGCAERTGRTGPSVKQFVNYIFGDTKVNCPGDSGGPRVHGFHTGKGGIWGINSGYKNPSGTDINGDAATNGPLLLRAVRAFGGTNITNTNVQDFAQWATTPGAKAVAGDFNGDGLGDVALVGGVGWATIPVALGNGAGGFGVTNQTVAEFPGWATAARTVVAADFNGDGTTDIALLGGPGWNTIPVVFSNRNGTFSVTNLQTPDIPAWAQHSGAYAVAGDFDGDGDGDIALLGGVGWRTIPIALSNRNGTFAQTNSLVSNFPNWSQTAGARAVLGDFDGDGDTDIALSGAAGWATIPVAFSQGDGTFSVTNNPVADFPTWATGSGVKLAAGDFDGDGDADIAAVGGPGWTTAGIAISDRRGSFAPANLPLAEFPEWARQARFVLSVRANSDRTSDLILIGANGWTSVPVAFFRR